MSIDLDWRALDDELCQRCLLSINAALSSGKRPSFLGDITATSFSLGTIAPDIELVEIRDVYEEFLHLDDDDEHEDVAAQSVEDDEQDESPLASVMTPTMRPPLGTPGPAGGLWMPRGFDVEHRQSSVTSLSSMMKLRQQRGGEWDKHSNISGSSYTGQRRRAGSPIDAQSAHGSNNGVMSSANNVSLQLHFRVKYTGDMSIGMQTAIKINFPTISFVSLPLAMKLSAIAFDGVFVVAYEGDRKRLHISLHNADGLDGSKARNVSPVHNARAADLLQDVRIESEVGTVDKLVLKDVRKIEQFVLDTARNALQVGSKN